MTEPNIENPDRHLFFQTNIYFIYSMRFESSSTYRRPQIFQIKNLSLRRMFLFNCIVIVFQKKIILHYIFQFDFVSSLPVTSSNDT